MAGFLREAIKTAVENAERRSYGNLIPDDEVTKTPQGDIVVKAMDNDDLMALNKALEEGGFQGGLNMGRIGEIFNTDPGDFDIETVLQNIKQNNVELFQHLRREKQSMESLMAMANATGFDGIVYKMLGRKPGEVMPAEDVLAGLVAVIKMGKEMEFGARKALNMPGFLPEQQAAREEAFKKLRIMATVQSNLAAQVSGNVSEYGRGLAVVSNVAKIEGMDLSTYADNLNNFIAEMDDGLIDYHLHTFLTLQKPAARAKYAEKGWASKTYDFAMENYINALLSAPTTHMVNIAGNASFQALTLAERGVAGVIGNIRTLGGLRGDIGDQRYVGEAAAEAFGLMMAQRDALTLMAKTFITGETGDLVSKIDLRNRRALGSTDNLADIGAAINQGDFTKSAIDTLGVATRLPGRFLASEDEYFKVISMRRVLYREAHRASQITFTSARRTGKSRDEAKALAEAKFTQIMTDTPKEVRDMMTSEARKLTFQGAPEGFFGRMGPLIQSVPGMKVIVPFYNTPTNVVNEAFDRTLNWSPVYKAIKGNISGPELDDALAKLAVGNTIALSMFALASGDYGDDVIITGSGPKDFGTKINIMGGANVPPYSIGIKQADGTYRFQTFSRFDPISAMLAMGADMAEYAKYEDDPQMLALMTKAYTLSAAEYAANMPFLQGVSELMAAAGGSFQTQEDFFERMAKFAGSQTGSVGTNVLGNLDRSTFGLMSYASEWLTDGQYPIVAQNSFYATLERLNNPIASNTMLPPGVDPVTGDLYTEAPAFMQGFYGALQQAKSRNPLFADGLPEKLNFWGNVVTAGEGRFSETFNPVRIQTGEFSALDEELIRLSEIGAGSFSFHNKRVNGTLLNAEQYNDFITTINMVDGKGRMLGDPGYNPQGTLLNALNAEMNTTEYATLPTDEDRFDALNAILSERRKHAREWIIGTDPQLNLLEMAN